jgi:hypothetical protein
MAAASTTVRGLILSVQIATDGTQRNSRASRLLGDTVRSYSGGALVRAGNWPKIAITLIDEAAGVLSASQYVHPKHPPDKEYREDGPAM